jgi:hypothetical protein
MTALLIRLKQKKKTFSVGFATISPPYALQAHSILSFFSVTAVC